MIVGPRVELFERSVEVAIGTDLDLDVELEVVVSTPAESSLDPTQRQTADGRVGRSEHGHLEDDAACPWLERLHAVAGGR
jgi:hypothetical protein